jgi:hypothetical protein
MSTETVTASDGVTEVVFHLGDYLSPRGFYPYANLAPDMERALAQGKRVFLLSVPGFMMVSGWPGIKKPWSACGGMRRKSFKTAAEALRY